MSTPHFHHQIPIKSAARKLPIKRKLSPAPSFPPTPTPLSTTTTTTSATAAASASADSNTNTVDNNHNVLLVPKAESNVGGPSVSDEEDVKPPPFKFHRIWSEADEIRFLQGLLDSSAEGLVFPRDLSAFYDRFSGTMPQPYTKSQLSEKLRRLRKKFRVVSARLSRGLDASHLTPHDRSLLHLSKQLWHPAFAASSPFCTHPHKPTPSHPAPPLAVRPVSVASLPPSPLARAVLDAFNRALDEVRSALSCPDRRPSPRSHPGPNDLATRWREQRFAELDVLARRLRLVLDHAVPSS